MGLITTLIGNYSRSKMEEQAQKTSEIQQRIQANQSILKDPNATPDAKQFAQTDITRLLYQHGGPEGKKHAPTIGTILGTLAGTMGEMAGVPRKQQAPAPAGAPPRLYMTPEEQAAKEQQDFTRKAQMEETERLRQGQQEYEARLKRGETIGLTGDALKRYAATGSLPSRFGEPEQPGTTKLTNVVTPDGKTLKLEYDPKTHKFFNVAGREVNLPEGTEFATDEGKLPGVLGELTRARQILNDPKASKEQKEAAQDFVDKQTREPTAVTTQKEAGEEADDIAAGIVRGDLPPDLTGLARGGIAAKVEAKLSKQGYNLAQAKNDWRGVQRWITTLNSNQQIRLQQAADFALESLDVLDNPKAPGDDLIGQLRAKVPRSKFPVLNRAAIAAAKGGAFGDDAANIATQVDSQITDLQSEIAVVYKGGGSPTDKGLEQSQKILSSDWSDKTLRGAIGLARRNLGLRLNSVRNVGPQGLSPAGQERYSPGAGAGTGEPASGAGGGESKATKRWNPQTGKLEDVPK